MPQAIATALIAAVGAAGLAEALITVAVYIGFSAGVNALVSSIFGRPSPKPSDGQQVVRTSVGSRTRHYGIIHTGANLSFLERAR